MFTRSQTDVGANTQPIEGNERWRRYNSILFITILFVMPLTSHLVLPYRCWDVGMCQEIAGVKIDNNSNPSFCFPYSPCSFYLSFIPWQACIEIFLLFLNRFIEDFNQNQTGRMFTPGGAIKLKWSSCVNFQRSYICQLFATRITLEKQLIAASSVAFIVFNYFTCRNVYVFKYSAERMYSIRN